MPLVLAGDVFVSLSEADGMVGEPPRCTSCKVFCYSIVKCPWEVKTGDNPTIQSNGTWLTVDRKNKKPITEC